MNNISLSKFLVFLLIILILFSCSSNIKSNDTKTITEQSLNNDLVNNNYLLTYSIPEGYDFVQSNDEDTTVYFNKKSDPEGKEGYISISSLDKINLSLDDLIGRYCSYFDEDDNIISYTYETYLNKNEIQCLTFILELSDYFDRICYVLTDDRDICVDAIYYNPDSDIINGFNELVDSVTD